MNTYPFAAVAEEHRADLLRAAGCCTAPHTHRRALPPVLRRRLTLAGPPWLGQAADPLLRVRTARVDGDRALTMSLFTRGRFEPSPAVPPLSRSAL